MIQSRKIGQDIYKKKPKRLCVTLQDVFTSIITSTVLITPHFIGTGPQQAVLRVAYGGCHAQNTVGLKLTVPAGIGNIAFSKQLDWVISKSNSAMKKRQVEIDSTTTKFASFNKTSSFTKETKAATITSSTLNPTTPITSELVRVTTINGPRIPVNVSTITLPVPENVPQNTIIFTGGNIDPNSYKDFPFSITVPLGTKANTIYYFPVEQICLNETLSFSDINPTPQNKEKFDSPFIIINSKVNNAVATYNNGILIASVLPSLETNSLYIDSNFALKNNLEQNKFVTVTILDPNTIKKATSVNVEPLTEDDWEVLNLNQQKLEEVILNQVTLVSFNLIIPLRVNQSLIYLKVLELNATDNRCLLLGNDTELIVKPKERKKKMNNEGKNSIDKIFLNKFRVLNPRMPSNILDSDAAICYLNSNTKELAIFDSEIKAFGGLVCLMEVVGIRGESLLHVKVATSPLVPDGHIFIPTFVKQQYSIKTFSQIRLFKVNYPPLKNQKVVIRKVITKKSNDLKSMDEEVKENMQNHSLADNLKQKFKFYLKKHLINNKFLIFEDNLMFKLNDEKEEIVITLNFFDKLGGNFNELKQLRKPGYLKLCNCDGFFLAVSDDPFEQPDYLEETVLLGCDEPILDDLPTFVGNEEKFKAFFDFSSIFFGFESIKKALNIRSSSSFGIFGGQGTGKTVFSKTILKIMMENENYLTYPFMVDCKQLSKIAIKNFQEIFVKILEKTSSFAPAIIFFEDLDYLLFNETKEGADPSLNNFKTSVFLKFFKTTLLKNMMVIFSAKEKSSLNENLLKSNFVSSAIEFKLPDQSTRKKILESFQPHLSLDLTSSKTDGFTPLDLKTLNQRAIQNQCIEDRVRLEEIDYLQAIKGYLPSRLKGVKFDNKDKQKIETLSWKDVGGLENAKTILKETLDFPTKYKGIFSKCNLRLRSGILLYGYPGCGKTFLSQTLQHEFNLNFISCKGPEILNKYIGGSEKAVRDLFDRAASSKPCVLFFDEFDSIAPRRGHDNTGVTDRVVNQLLTLMDGAEGLDGVYVLAATSRPDMIDPALLRPGRLDKTVKIDLPDFKDRLKIIETVKSKMKFEDAVDFGEFDLDRFTGADIQGWLYSAYLLSVHEILDLKKGLYSGGNKKAVGQENSYVGEREEVKMIGTGGNVKVVKRLYENIGSDGKDNVQSNKKETIVFVGKRHLEASLKECKPSLSQKEFLKFKKYFDEFEGGKMLKVGSKSTLG
ncbi:Peroxisome biosynthesis protein pex1 [Lobulomyces angularis]|nr:Peroxisome biosynthesis protein pex1 [Lobulomyces angularis]